MKSLIAWLIYTAICAFVFMVWAPWYANNHLSPTKYEMTAEVNNAK